MASILLIESDALVRECLAARFESDGHRTESVTTGGEALTKISGFHPDLVLLDLALADLDGLSVLAALRKRAPDVAIVAIGSAAQPQRVLAAERLGASQCLRREEFSFQGLLRLIEATLQDGSPGVSDHDRPSAGSAPSATASSGERAMAAQSPGRSSSDRASAQQARDSGEGFTEIAASKDSDRAQPAGGETSEDSNRGDGEGEPRPEQPADLPEAMVAEAERHADAGDLDEALKALKPVITRSELKERLEEAGELKALSPAVMHVLSITNNPNCSIDDLVKAIRRDHAISLKLLQLANSSLYTRGDPVESLKKAAVRIGLDQIREALLNLAVVESFSGSDENEDFSSALFWEHAIACGLIASEIARVGEHMEPDFAFTMGLIHDAGRMVYHEAFGSRYRQALRLAHRLGLPAENVEKRLFLEDHAAVMDQLLHAWKFSKRLIEPVVHHHVEPNEIRRSAPKDVLETQTLALADRMAHALLLGHSGNDLIRPIEPLVSMLELEPETISQIEADAPGQVDDLKLALLAHSHEQAWKDRQEQLRDKLPEQTKALYISAQEESDALRMFFSSLNAGQPGAPTVAVVRLRKGREQTDLAERLAEAERKAGVGPLPVLVALDQSSLTPAAERLAGERPYEALSTPLPVGRLIESLNRLLTPAAAAQAA